MIYLSNCCKKLPVTNVVMSKPSIGGEYEGYRKYLIETKEGNLWGVCSECNKSGGFFNKSEKFIMDVKSIYILKEMMNRDDNFDENGELTQEAKDYIEKRNNEK